MHDSSFCRKAFTLCICLLFSGCAASLSDANVKGEKAVTENISLADSMNLTQPSDGSSDAAQMKIISSANGIIASSILGNEKGCYEVFDRPANGGNLLYTDYATKSHIYLSNQINSDHNNESDTSYLESTIGGCYLALSDDYLFIFKLNTPSFAADETSERQGYIARCDLDGADRQILTKLAANESIVSGCVVLERRKRKLMCCLRRRKSLLSFLPASGRRHNYPKYIDSVEDCRWYTTGNMPTRFGITTFHRRSASG